MPSPFPGMDPYLERPDIFPDLHGSLIILLKQELQHLLPESYYASSSQRIWIDASERHIETDVDVVRIPRPEREQQGSWSPTESPSMPIVIEVSQTEWVENYLEISTQSSEGRRLVTSIEVLSPSNKTKGSRGRELYLRKQREILGSQTHLVEFDLLRTGLHTTAIPEESLRQKVPQFDYHCCIHHFDRPAEYSVYPVLIERPLPPVHIPLLPDDGAVEVAFQEVFDRAYDTGPYRKQISYDDDPPPPPFEAERREWIRRTIPSAKK